MSTLDERSKTLVKAHEQMVEKEYVPKVRDHLWMHLGCSNCGEPAGSPCRHDQGCIDLDRKVR